MSVGPQGDAEALDGNIAYAHEHSKMVGTAEEEVHLAKRVRPEPGSEPAKPAARRGRAKVDQEGGERRKRQLERLREQQQESAARFEREEQAQGTAAAALRALARFHRSDAVVFARRFQRLGPEERRALVEAFVNHKAAGAVPAAGAAGVRVPRVN